MANLSKRAGMVQKKQLMYGVGIVGGILAVSLIASVWMQPKEKVDPNIDRPKTRQLQIGGSANDREAWRSQSSAELERFNKRLQGLELADKQRQEVEKREAEAERQKKERESAEAAMEATRPKAVAPPVHPSGAPPEQGIFSQIGAGGTVVPPTIPGGAKPAAGPAAPATPSQPTSRIKTINVGEDAAGAAGAGGKTDAAKKAGDKRSTATASVGGEESVSGKEAGTYLPAGTFFRVAVLNGIDAPTGGQSQSNPTPGLLQVIDDAQLPNKVKAALKGCVVTGNGHGDLSSERAYIRTDRLSCVDEDGGAIDVAIRGYVSGEDGKAGLRGRLISKSGQVIANAILVGTLGGFGDALRQSATSQTGNAFGTQTQNVQNPWQYGIGGGVGKAMDRVAQYYIKLADKLFPVIEIDGGRVVDVVLTRGVSIERK